MVGFDAFRQGQGPAFSEGVRWFLCRVVGGYPWPINSGDEGSLSYGRDRLEKSIAFVWFELGGSLKSSASIFLEIMMIGTCMKCK